MYQQAIDSVKKVIEFVEENNLTNTQEFLDFLDELNRLSVTH